jgi:hypothetical protein
LDRKEEHSVLREERGARRNLQSDHGNQEQTPQ